MNTPAHRLNSSSNEVRLGEVSEAAAARLAQDSQGGDKIASGGADGGDKLALAIANSGEKIASVIAAADAFQREATRLRSRAIRPSLLGVAPAPPLRRRRSWLGVMGGIIMVAAVLVGVVAVGQWSFPVLWQQASDRPVEFASSGVFRIAAPRLLVQASRATSGEPAPLGLTLQGRADGAVVMIMGLVPGMTLSTGIAIGKDAWQVPATALPDAWIGPPINFVGVVDLVAELQLADKTIADRRPVKLEWGAAIPAATAANPTVATDQTAVASPREPNVTAFRQHADEPTVATDQTAVAPPREPNVAPPRQLDADEPTIARGRTAVGLPREQDVATPRQRDADEPTVDTHRTAVAPPQEQTVAPSRQFDADEPTFKTDRTAVAPRWEQNVTAANEIAALLKRGADLIRNGDLAAARLVLQRAAEAKSAEAALALAATYDPVILRKLKVYGFASDVGMARSWYERAKELGSAAASQRLEILANAAR